MVAIDFRVQMLLSLFFACSIYHIVPAEVPQEPLVIQVTEYSELASFGTVNIELFRKSNHFIPASIRLIDREKTIYIDPLNVNPIEKADFILITHSHSDHFSKRDIEQVATEDTVIIGPKSVVSKLKGYNTRVVQPSKEYQVNGLSFHTVPAYNISKHIVGIRPHPPQKGFVGYIIEIDGQRIYHPGDTDVIPELLSLTDIDLAMIPIGSENGLFTMSTPEAIGLINQIRPRAVLPIHYRIGEGYEDEFKRGIAEGIQVLSFGIEE